MARSRSICFTLNNYTEEEVTFIRAACVDEVARSEHNIRILGFGFEVGEETGTPHLQGFIYFNQPRSFAQVHRIPGFARGSFMVMNGSIDQNINYCKKQGDYHQYGEPPAQGKRSDLDEVVELVRQGKRPAEIAESCPIQFIKFHKGIERLLNINVQPRDFKTEVYWFYGPTGTGKSKIAFEHAKAANSYYVKDPLNKWWDGYEQQDVVIIDDYRRDFSTFASLLRLFDRYQMTVENKGGTTQFRSKVIFITTPKSVIGTWENRSEEDIAQLSRRITRSVHFDVLGSNVGFVRTLGDVITPVPTPDV